MKKIYIIATTVFICMLLTTCSIPGLYGRWSVEKNKVGCPQEIVINKHEYNSGIAMAESTSATFTNFDSKRQVIDSPVYSVEHLNGDWYNFNPHDNDSTTVIPKVMKISLSFEGRKLIFKKDHSKTECKYNLEADYELIGRELFGDVYS